MKALLICVAGFCFACTALAQEKLAVKVDGEGYLRFMQEGKSVYAKAATLVVRDGRLVDVSGAKLVPAVTCASLADVTVDLEGHVLSGGKEVGRIVLATFSTALQSTGEQFMSSAFRPTLGNPGEGALGVIRTSDSIVRVYKADETSPEPSNTLPTPQKSAGSLATDIPKVASSGVRVTISDDVEVDGTTFELGQIAKVDGSSTPAQHIRSLNIGDTPPFGVERIIDRTRILARIKASGINPDTVTLLGPDKIRVRRKGQKLTHDQFIETALRGATMKGFSASLESSLPGPDMTAPLGESQLICESVTKNESGLTVAIGVYVDGKRFNSRTVRLKLTGPVTSLKPGSLVKVKVLSNGVSIVAGGKVVKVDQATGSITVQITDTGAVLVGRLAQDGSVEVKA